MLKPPNWVRTSFLPKRFRSAASKQQPPLSRNTQAEAVMRPNWLKGASAGGPPCREELWSPHTNVMGSVCARTAQGGGNNQRLHSFDTFARTRKHLRLGCRSGKHGQTHADGWLVKGSALHFSTKGQCTPRRIICSSGVLCLFLTCSWSPESERTHTHTHTHETKKRICMHMHTSTDSHTHTKWTRYRHIVEEESLCIRLKLA